MNKTVYFDLETSGLSPWKNEIIQIAAIAVRNSDYSEVERFGPFYVRFDISKANPEALRICHYTEEKWKDAISQEELVKRFGDFLRDHATVQMISRAGNPYQVAQLAGHNVVRFDMPFLQATFKREGGSFLPARLIGLDTLQLAAWHYYNDDTAPKNLKLEDLYVLLTGKEFMAHDAMEDVVANIELAKRLLGVDNDDLPF